MIDSRPYDVNFAEFIREKEIERLRAQVQLFWPKEARALRGFGLADGASVLEVGSGPGFVTERLLRELPRGSVTGIEVDHSLIRDAERHLQRHGARRYRLVEGSITDPGLPGESYDFAIARLVLQHIPQPAMAAEQIYKLLKPGGRLVVTEIDLDLMGIVDPMPEAYRVVNEKYERFILNRGSNRRIGRRLWRLLKAAGFVNLQLELVAAHSDEAGIDAFKEQFDPDALSPLVHLGVLAPQELEAFREARKAFLSSQPYLLVPLIMVCGEKPDAK
jgi:ubiquinone/menaquinone biosynthesis C-methylase UbiE